MNKNVAALFLIACVAITIVVAFVVVAWYNYRLKKRIIESGPIDGDALGFLKRLSSSRTEALKWGCIVFAGGLGLVINDFIPSGPDSYLPYGLEAMFVAAGFLTYYVLVNRQDKI